MSDRISRMLFRLVLLIVWPPVAVVLAGLMALCLALCWAAIPFIPLRRADHGIGWTVDTTPNKD